MALFDPEGHMLPLCLDGESVADQVERVFVLDERETRLVFKDLDVSPIPSLLRGFSAPVELDYDIAPEHLAILLRDDPDGYNRWAAGQRLSAQAFDALHAGQSAPAALSAWTDALTQLYDDDSIDPALLAELLMPASEIVLAERLAADVDPEHVHAARQTLLHHLARCIGAERLSRRFDALQAVAEDTLDAAAQARRRLKGVVLQLLWRLQPDLAHRHAHALLTNCGNMTDRLLALRVQLLGPQASLAARLFRDRHQHQPLALDKWFMAQALVPGDATLARVQLLLDDPAFTLRNPNRVNALLGNFARGNPTGFHRTDGGGYRLLADTLARLDALNPQVAARLATTFNGWRRFEPLRRQAAQDALTALADRPGLSRDLSDILGRALEG
jgi:aminopeptidase N